jgi:hypothetical protein
MVYFLYLLSRLSSKGTISANVKAVVRREREASEAPSGAKEDQRAASPPATG